MTHAADPLDSLIYGKIFDENTLDVKFMPQERVFAPKPKHHLRRTLKLDPVAEYFLYDWVYRHRHQFRKPFKDNRFSYGYIFSDGQPISVSASYHAFRKRVVEERKRFRNSFIRFDINSYFNSVYHHDVVAWAAEDLAVESVAQGQIGQFLREINSGRTVDCLPQGIYPAKMIGSHFLKYVDNHFGFRSDTILRFMDDFFIFDRNEANLLHDFELAQKLLGTKSLNLNSQKTALKDRGNPDLRAKLTRIKKKLKVYAEDYIVSASGDIDFVMSEETRTLSQSEVDQLSAMLDEENLEEDDAEIILSALRDYSDSMLPHLPNLFARFPNLTKTLYKVLSSMDDANSLADAINDALRNSSVNSEYQLFWFTKLVEEKMLSTPKAEVLLRELHSQIMQGHHQIALAKFLEIPEKRFGMVDLKEQQIKSGASTWPTWSAAVGLRNVEQQKRNHALGYLRNNSQLNNLIAQAVLDFTPRTQSVAPALRRRLV